MATKLDAIKQKIETQNDRPAEIGSEHRPPYGFETSEMRDLPEKERGWLEAMRRNIPAIAMGLEQELAEARERLEADDELTETGVESRMAEVKEELRGKYLSDRSNQDLPGSGLAHQRYVANRVKKKGHQRRAEQPLFPEAEPSDARSAVREQALLEKLEAADPSDQAQLAREMVDSGRPEALRAIFDPPGGMTPLIPQRIKALRRRALRNQYGEEAVETEAMLEAGQKAEKALGHLESYVRGLLS